MEANLPFDQFLSQKGIDASRFEASLPAKYAQLQKIYGIAGAVALDYAQKFHWNDLRLDFPAERKTLEKE